MSKQASPTYVSPILAEFTGRISSRPVVRTRLDGPHGRAVPVLCVDITTDGAAAACIHIHQPFGPDAHAACEAAARRLKAGQHITVQAPLRSLRLIVDAAAHIHVDQEQPAP